MSWDDDDWEATNVLPGATKGEEGNDVVPEFSDEEVVEDDDDAPVETTKPKTNGNKNALKPKKKSRVQLNKEREEQLRLEQEQATKAKAMTDEEKMAEKLRLQKLVEEADNKLTDELFNVKREQGVYDEDTVAATLQTIPLETEENFKNFASAIGKRLELEDKEVQTREFIKELLRSVAPSLPYEDLADIDNVLSVVKNTKVKTKLNKKKKNKKKMVVKVQRDILDDVDQQGAGGAYDDEYDFM